MSDPKFAISTLDSQSHVNPRVPFVDLGKFIQRITDSFLNIVIRIGSPAGIRERVATRRYIARFRDRKMGVEDGELAQDFSFEEGARLLEFRHFPFLFGIEEVDVWSKLVILGAGSLRERVVTLKMCPGASTMPSCLSFLLSLN